MDISVESAFFHSEIDRVSSLDVSSFSIKDALNLALQRSRILSDQPKYNKRIKAWTKGDDEPLLELIDKLGKETIIRRAAALIFKEYQEMRPVFEEAPPHAVTDIGCGYAFFDLFIAEDFGCVVNLIDVETSEDRHFGFKNSGAAYSNLKTAAEMLSKNGVLAERISTFNPQTQDLSGIKDQDLVVSFISCGFHYPWTTYDTFFRTAVPSGGRIILDIRKHHEHVQNELSELGKISVLPEGANAKSRRLLIERA